MRLLFKISVITLAIGLATGTTAQARNLSYIRDTEIENAIRYYSAPIFEAAGLDVQTVRIHLVNDQRLNAFVAGGQRIFIHTGLLTEADDASQVIGVIAHETGHITGGHLAQFEQIRESAQAQQLATMLLGIPLALATGRGDVAAASITLGTHIGQRSFLQYTRAMEQSADQAAVSFLDEAKISARGLLVFFEKLKRNEALYSADQNPYTRSHPLTDDRMTFVRHHVQISRYSDNALADEYKLLHDRVRAKLRGYLLPSDQVASLYPASDTSVPARYARAISLMRQHKFEEALAATDRLISESPKDPFFHELRGDVLFDAGRMQDAVEAFGDAIDILPWAAMIRQSRARAYIELGSDDDLEKAVDDLKEAVRYEPWSTFNWRLLATAYGRLDDQGNTALALAEEAIRQNKKDQAKTLSKRAMDQLPQGSPGWLRAQDIEFQAGKPGDETDIE